MKPSFTKYNHIDNATESSINYFCTMNDKEIANLDWVALEKVHGSNYLVTLYTENNSNNVSIEYGKRTSYLGNDLTFFNHGEIDRKYKNNFIQLYNYIEKNNKNNDNDNDKNKDNDNDKNKDNKDNNNDNKEKLVINLRGELFGGCYPGVPNKFKKIQDGVFYTNEIEFIVFDIEINGKTINDDLRVEYCSKNNVPFLKQEKRGKLNDLIFDLTPIFESTIPNYYNMPLIANNKAEGWILKPVEPKYMKNGSRVILKLKNDKFCETNNNKKKNNNPNKLKKNIKYSNNNDESQNLVEKDMTDINNLFEILKDKITINRKNNVLSKYSENEFNHPNKLKIFVINDAIDEFNRDSQYDNNINKTYLQILNNNNNNNDKKILIKILLDKTTYL